MNMRARVYSLLCYESSRVQHFDRQNSDVKFVSSILLFHFTAFTFLHDNTWSQTCPNPFYMLLCIYMDPNVYLGNSKNAMHWLCDLAFNSIW